MKRIGIIGGMSYESTLHYYERINRQVNERAGGLISADLVLRSVNFEEYHRWMETDDWDKISDKLSDEAFNLVTMNKCDYVAIATNTMHKVADEVAGPHKLVDDLVWPSAPSWVSIPFVHIGDCIAEKCKEVGAKRVALLGTKFTMTEDFMKKRLEQHGLEVYDKISSSYIEWLDGIIFNELCKGIVNPNSVREFKRTVEEQLASIVDAVILGCTELNMLERRAAINNFHTGGRNVYIIDSTEAHINKLVELCLED